MARLASLVFVVLVALPLGTGRADTVTGANGSAGAAGALCQSGQPGGDGGDAAAGQTADVADATATGGDGGNGGRGGDCSNGDGGDGGAGGAGGEAAARAAVSGSGLVAVSASATGGRGGSGAAGGIGSLGAERGAPGDGADGGNAVADASANGNTTVVSGASAVAQGGSGGFATGLGARAGDGGTASGSAYARAQNAASDVAAYLEVRGGDGGSGANGALPGDGADVQLIDAVDGDAPGSLTLTQRAVAGSGGNADAAAGAAGDALSALTRAKTSSSLELNTVAIAGNSGTPQRGGDSVHGGSAQASVDGRNDGGDLVVRYGAIGGSSGFAFGSAQVEVGDRGGDATANARAVTSGDGNSVTLGLTEFNSPPGDDRVVGGAGGFGEQQGGEGGTATTTAEGIAEGNSEVDVLASADGGGGGGSSDGIGGRGGTGGATAAGRNAGASAVRVTAIATGGNGGAASTGGTGGTGGTATASAGGESSGGANVTVTARATGGAGSDGGTGGSVGLLNAVSGATTGVLRLVQEARGGGQPDQFQSNSGGPGGDASSALDWTDSDGGRLELDVSAVAGGGGFSGDIAGSAHAEARGIGQNDVSVVARTQGDAMSTLGPVFGASLGGGRVRVEGELTGFMGVAGEQGVDAVVEDAVDGATGGVLELFQRAVGGASGQTPGGGAPARGGFATSRLTRSVTVSDLQAHIEAIGGAGYNESTDSRFGKRLPSDGGDALSESSVTNDAGAAKAFVYALGGTGGGAYSAIVGGRGGDATVRAEASSLGDGHEVVMGGSSNFGAVGGEARLVSATGTQGTRASGGDAISASTGTAAGNSRVTVRDRATGGRGGSGGSATSHAEGHNQGSERVSVLAEAIGGAVAPATDGAGGEARATARGTSTTGDVDVTALQTSGANGSVQTGDGRAGVASHAINAVSGSTAGTLTLRQRAVGGAGGFSSATATSGAGGHANSSLEATNEGGGALILASEALGGIAGLHRATGGSATASVRGIGAGSSAVAATASATGGAGYFDSSVNVGGDGGVAELGEVSGRSDLGGSVRVRGEVFGGNGGALGRGADAHLVNAVTGSTTGQLILEQVAVAGSGGQAGSASSSLDFSAAALSLELHSEARPGTVIPSASVISATGGDASALVRGENTAGSVSVFGLVDGFVHPGFPFPGPAYDGGDGGAGTVSAFARTTGDGHDVMVGAFPSAAGSRRNGAYAEKGRNREVGPGGAGSGGLATSSSEGEAAGNSTVRVFDVAVGGDGGSNTRSDGFGGNGIGGRGGDAISSAVGRNAGDASVEVRAEALAGDGGFGRETGGDGGTASATARGFSEGGGDVSVTAIQSGGAGGGLSGFPTGPTTVGRGADSIMRDAVGGATAGRLSLVQRAIAGHGPGSGPGGAATSDLTAMNAGGGDLAVVVEATGGDGKAGGAAHARAVAEGAGSAAVLLEARASGGSGGLASGGDGGAATLGLVSGLSTAGGAVAVMGQATGGIGGHSRTGGGDGASVLLDNAVQGNTSGSLSLTQRAIGGSAGSINFDFGASGSAGVAGSAVSRLDQIARATHFSVTSTATGGDSGDRATIGHLDAANAEATADATNESGGLDVVARAQGGLVRGSGVAGAGGDANVSVLARTTGDGQDIRVGQSFAATPSQSVMGAIGGAGGTTVAGHGGGGNASSSSSAIALGNSSVEVYDLAIGGSPLQGSAFDRIRGGDASSLASAITAGTSRALAQSLAIGGTGSSDAGDAVSRADAEGLGEVQAAAVARVSPTPLSTTFVPSATADATARGLGSSGSTSATATSGTANPFFGTFTGVQAISSAPVLADATALARARASGVLSAADLAAGTDAAALIARGNTQTEYWGSAALGLEDTQLREEASIMLRSEAVFSGSASASVLAAGLYVSFLSVDLDAAGFEQLAFRITDGTTALLERIFEDETTAGDFFSQNLFLTGLNTVPGRFDLHFVLELTSNRTGSGFGTVFALGTTPIPEPGTGTLMMLGLIALIVYRRVEARPQA